MSNADLFRQMSRMNPISALLWVDHYCFADAPPMRQWRKRLDFIAGLPLEMQGAKVSNFDKLGEGQPFSHKKPSKISCLHFYLY